MGMGMGLRMCTRVCAWVRVRVRVCMCMCMRMLPQVEHCSDAWGVVLRHASGWSLCYSGDTRPCAALTRAARGATLLLHEATFADAEAEHARIKRHSTHGEAREVARQMGAYRTLLTHLSARYDAGEKRDAPAPAPASASAPATGAGARPPARCHVSTALLPAIEALAGSGDTSTAVAFDLMVLNLCDLPSLPSCTPRLAGFVRGAQQLAQQERQACLAAQLARSQRLEAGLAAAQ